MAGFLVSLLAVMGLGQASVGPWFERAKGLSCRRAHAQLPFLASLVNRALAQGWEPSGRYAEHLLLGQALHDDHP